MIMFMPRHIDYSYYKTLYQLLHTIIAARSKKMNVLSLCDGMSCGQIALRELDIPIENYFAAEIKESAIKVTQENFPSTIQIGDVNKISYKNGNLITEKGEWKVDIDLVMFGSPCQTFSNCCPAEQRIGLENKEKSGLFLECYRILKEVNPSYFFVENVSSMKKEDRDTLSSMLQCQPYCVDAKLVGPVLRKRYYWTNIPFNSKDIKPKNITMNDILTDGYCPREKGLALLVSHSRPNTTPIKLFYRSQGRSLINIVYKSEEHYKAAMDYFTNKYGRPSDVKAGDIDINDPGNKIFEGVRCLNQTEYERCHAIPEGYTSCLSWKDAADVIGDGWQIDVIKEFFKGLK